MYFRIEKQVRTLVLLISGFSIDLNHPGWLNSSSISFMPNWNEGIKLKVPLMDIEIKCSRFTIFKQKFPRWISRSSVQDLQYLNKSSLDGYRDQVFKIYNIQTKVPLMDIEIKCSTIFKHKFRSLITFS